MIWNVQVAKDDFATVKADTVTIEDGCLVFRNTASPNQIVLALAFDQWLTVHGDEDGRVALEEERQTNTTRPGWAQSITVTEKECCHAEIHPDEDRGRVRRIWDRMRS